MRTKRSPLACGRPRCPCSWMKLQLKGSTCSTMDERIKEIKRLWIIKMDDCEYMKKLVDSLARRLEEVIERQGASTKY